MVSFLEPITSFVDLYTVLHKRYHKIVILDLFSIASDPSLYLETSRLSSASSLLELSSLGSDSGSSSRAGNAGGFAEVSLSSAGLGRSSKEYSVRAFRRSESELIKSDTFTTSLEDSSSGSLGELERAYAQLWNLEKSCIIGNCSDDDGGLSGIGLHMFHNLR